MGSLAGSSGASSGGSLDYPHGDPVGDPQARHQDGMMQATALYNAERLLKSALKYGMLLLPRATLDQRFNY